MSKSRASQSNMSISWAGALRGSRGTASIMSISWTSLQASYHQLGWCFARFQEHGQHHEHQLGQPSSIMSISWAGALRGSRSTASIMSISWTSPQASYHQLRRCFARFQEHGQHHQHQLEQPSSIMSISWAGGLQASRGTASIMSISWTSPRAS